MTIDAHTHLFSLDTARYPLANPDSDYQPVLEGSATLLKQRLDEAGIDRALTITTGFYGWDNSYAMDQLKGNESWLAVGVLVDPASKEAPRALDSLVAQGACGLRIQRHLFYHQALDDSVSTPLWRKAADLDLTVDINATVEEYDSVRRRVQEFPDTRFVLDHCGYVSGALRPELNTVKPALDLARFPNVYAKITFLPLASETAYPFKDVHWMASELMNGFGAERCLFGTNYPAEQYSPNASMKNMAELFRNHLDMTVEQRRLVMGGTAARLWRWGS